ncbi:fungal-specific transcription factor domain-containing protein [Flagelloscypha sp. PMI_526]|nr:fungal-specific transcription factor domain-containing protein [Flagelloscypha sp. PMI_526]
MPQSASSNNPIALQSSTDDEPARKKRMPGSCDNCRKRKVRSREMPGNRCTRCIKMGLECTHDGALKSYGSVRGVVEELEAKLDKCEHIIARFVPGATLDDLDGLYERIVLGDSGHKKYRIDNDEDEARATARLQYLKLSPSTNRFWGQSSNLMFIETALRVKDEHDAANQNDVLNTHKRSEFWNPRPWQIPTPPDLNFPLFNFPDVQLLCSLSDLYFDHVNNFFPLLHRPTFEQSLVENLHHRDRGFGATILAFYWTDINEEQSAGWKWMSQVKLGNDFNQQVTLFELQQYALYAIYAEGFMISDGWVFLGIALRRAVEVGAHRKRTTVTPTHETELWKRAVWVLIWLERSMSTFFGRSVCIHEEDFDLPYPLEVDDEVILIVVLWDIPHFDQQYWDSDFKQPTNLPSKISMFNSLLRLMEVQAHLLRTVYKTKKHRFSPLVLSIQQFMSNLDKAMNTWTEKDVPAHRGLFGLPLILGADTSKPFIPLRDRPAIYPSLAIATNAARALLSVLSTPEGEKIAMLPSVQAKAWIAGMMLLIHVWSGLRSGLAPNPKKDREDVAKSVRLMSNVEARYQVAGRLKDILAGLADLATITDNDPKAGVTSHPKRSRGDLDPSDSPPTQSTSPSTDIIPTDLPASSATTLFPFPTASAGLSELPVFDFSAAGTNICI